MLSFPLEECHWCLLKPTCEVKAKLLRHMQIAFFAFYETTKGYTLGIHGLHNKLSFVRGCHNQSMFFTETKWKDCILIVIALIVTSQIKPFGLIHTSSRSCVHCCLLVGRCGW